MNLQIIQSGDFVKIARGGERFWVKLVTVNEGSMTGTVNNELVETEVHGIRFGDKIALDAQDVLDVWMSDDGARIAKTSPALENKAGDYPEEWEGKIPYQIRMVTSVKPDIPNMKTIAKQGSVYCCWVNMHGAVAAIFANGEKLGVRPDAFEVVEWHP